MISFGAFVGWMLAAFWVGGMLAFGASNARLRSAELEARDYRVRWMGCRFREITVPAVRQQLVEDLLAAEVKASEIEEAIRISGWVDRDGRFA